MASALRKLDTWSKRLPMQASPSTAHLFIVQPLVGDTFGSLFSTHPPIAKRIERLTGVPLGPTGKIDRTRLPAPPGGPAEAPGNIHDDADEAVVAEIFREVLGRRDIAEDDDFFELGGNSLQATRLVKKLRKTFDVTVGLPALFENATVAGIAKLVSAG